MPKASILQASFSSGEVSPLYYGQADNPRYKKGLQTCQNYIPTLQGPIIRRPGTKFCANVKDSTKPPTLIPFQFSETQAYILEFGDHYIRFFANNGQIVTTGTTYILECPVPYFNGFSFSVFASRPNKFTQTNEQGVVVISTPAIGSILEIGSPYSYLDVPQIKFAQSNDTLYLVHPKYPPFKLQRQAQTFWKLSPIQFQDGPYFELNSYATPGDYSNVVMSVSAYSTTAPYQAALITTAAASIVNATNDGTGQIKIQTGSNHNIISGQNVYVSGVGGTTEANNWNSTMGLGGPPAYWPAQVIDAVTLVLEGSTFVHAYTSGGTTQPAVFGPDAASFQSSLQANLPDWGRLFSFSLTMNPSTVINRFYGYITDPSLIGVALGWTYNAATWIIAWPGATTLYSLGIIAWQMGVYSSGAGNTLGVSTTLQGFPSCVAIHQNRLVLGGPGSSPQEVDGSVVGQYENFAPADPVTQQVTDKNSYSFILASSQSNQLIWMASSAQGLLTASSVAEWNITPSGASEAITPTNFNAQQTSFYGTANAGSVQLGNSTFYIQRALRKIREMAFFFQAGTYRSIDLTEISEHITLPTVTQLSVTKETQPLIWAVLSNGTLISMVYNRDDLSLVAGWTRHTLGGQSDSSGTPPIVSSIASIPSPDLSFDQLWLVVARDSGVQIEYMAKIFDDSFLQEDAYHFDGGGTFYNPFTITGITIASPGVVTATGPSSWPGFSNGDHIRIEGVVGLSVSTVDANGNVTTTNLVNNTDFIVAGVSNVTAGPTTTSTFHLTDYLGNPISSVGYGSYISGGLAAKLVTTISGATWLDNKTVSVLADGGIHPDVLVSNTGTFNLKFPAAKVQFGYGYKSQVQLLRPDAGSPDGTSIGKTRRTTRLAIQFHRTGEMSMGTTFKNMIPIQFSQIDSNQADQPQPLFSGILRDGLESAYDFDSQPCFQQSSGLPGCIQSVTSFMEEQDV